MQDIARSLQDLEDAGGGNPEGGGKVEEGGGGVGGVGGDVGFTTITAADDAIRDARALADPHPMWKAKESKGGDEGIGASSSSSSSYDQHPCAALASTGSIEFYSPVKNNMADAAAKARAGTSPASASAGEAAIYAASCKMLLALGCDVEAPVWCEWGKLDGDVDTRLTLPQWSRVVFAPRFAVGLQRLSTRFIQPGKVVVRQNATLVLDGSNVTFTDQLCVDGALVVTAVEGAEVEINGLVVRNEGWVMVPLGTDGEEEGTHAESIRIRGYSLKKAQTCELVFSEPGKYVVSMAGGEGSAVRGSVSMEFTTPGEHTVESSSSSFEGAPGGGEGGAPSLDERILEGETKGGDADAASETTRGGRGGRHLLLTSMWGVEGIVRTERTVTATHCEFQEINSCSSWTSHIFCPLDFTWLFDSQIDADALERSLSAALDMYPVLAGRYIDCGARVACNNQGVPLTVATLSGLSIRDIPQDPEKGAFCDIRNLAKVADGEDAILTVTLTRFDDGCALGVTMNHGCSDGSSFGNFMRDWSDCHAGKQIEPVLMGLSAEARRVPYEAEIEHLTKTDLTKHFRKVWSEVASNSTKRAECAARGAVPAGRQRLHFSGDALHQLKQEAEEGADTWVSTNEALLAHVYLLLLDAAGVQDRKKCGIAAAVDLRGKVGGVIPPRMLGRAVVNTDAIAGEELLVDLSDPSKAGERVHNAMRQSLDSSKLLSRYRGVCYFYATAVGLSGPSPQSTHQLSWNFQGRSPFYAVDFGAGTAVRGVPWNCNEEIKIAPCAQGGGFDVFISDAASLRGWAEHDFVGQVVAANQLANPM